MYVEKEVSIMLLTPLRSIATLALALALPATVLADNTATLTTGQSISFDTFTVGANGDATFTGAALTFTPGVKAYNWGPMGSSFYQPLNGGELAALNAFGTNNPIPLTMLVAGDVFSVLTKCGNVANALVTASTSSSLGFRYGTFLPGEATPVAGGGCDVSGGGGPTISRVTNNSSDIPAGFPNSGISQGALFKVVGTALADDGDANLHDSGAPGGLPTLLNNAKVTVTVGNVTVTVALYYATPT